MYKVFINESVLKIIESNNLKRCENDLSVEYKNKDSIKYVINEIEKISIKNKTICLHGENELEIWGKFCSFFQLIEAAGGLVKNEKGEYLFIFRKGKWDLPKGKLEKGESIQECAVREVEEECGIKNLEILKELPSTYHTYYVKGKPVLKRSYWFEMTSTSKQKLKPQLEEDITDIKWVTERVLPKIIENSYSSIKELFMNV